MVKYFEYFPHVKYNNQELLDITKRVNILDRFKNDPYAFLPYTVEGNDRPEDVSYHYYGSVQYTWLVYMANGIVDPYNEWPKTDSEFDRYLIKKYTKLSKKVGFEVLTWLQNETITENIVHYVNKTDITNIISPDTYKLGSTIPGFVHGDWKPVRYHEYELIKDNNKRNIYLVNQLYVDQMDKELKDAMNESR